MEIELELSGCYDEAEYHVNLYPDDVDSETEYDACCREADLIRRALIAAGYEVDNVHTYRCSVCVPVLLRGRYNGMKEEEKMISDVIKNMPRDYEDRIKALEDRVAVLEQIIKNLRTVMTDIYDYPDTRRFYSKHDPIVPSRDR